MTEFNLATQSFVIYSLPGETEFWTCHQENFGTSEMPNSFSSGFFIQPFDSIKSHTFIAAENIQLANLAKLRFKSFHESTPSEIAEKPAYLKAVATAIKRAKEMNGKVVLSRIDEIHQPRPNIEKSLVSMRQKFPNAFVYLLNVSALGTWMGATPELLVEQFGVEFRSMALAGTKWGQELFSNKEFEEQMLVTRDIINQLRDTELEVSDMYEDQFGELRHLRTDFRWQDDRSILDFAKKLHPTPAICGYPRQNAMRVVVDLENHSRALYTGYLGILNVKDQSKLFVNLRCMQLFRDRVRVYVGGGINAQSVPSAEWEETERKKLAVCSAIHYD